MTEKRRIGNQGEAIAIQTLESKSYSIIERNWQCRYGELDIVAKLGETWVFCEVKTAQGLDNQTAKENFTPQKVSKLLKAIHYYLAEHGIDDVLWRLDLIAIAIPAKAEPKVEHLEDVLDW